MNTDKTYAEQLAAEYAPKDTSRIAALRKLDRHAKLPATVLAYSLGIVGTLIMGVGMCLSMRVIGNGSAAMVGLGIATGVAGLVLVGVNYPVYRKVLARGRERYAADIVRLAGEIARG